MAPTRVPGVRRRVDREQGVLQLARDAGGVLVEPGAVEGETGLPADGTEHPEVRRLGAGVRRRSHRQHTAQRRLPGEGDHDAGGVLLNLAGAGRRQHLGARRRGRVLLPPHVGDPRSPSGPASHTVAADPPSGPVAASSSAATTASRPRASDSAAVAACSAATRAAECSAGSRRGLQLALVPQPLPRTGDGGAREPALRAGHRTEEDRQAAPGHPQLERDLVEAPLHVQQRREVRLPEDARADREDLLQAQAPQLGGVPAHPLQKGRVRLENGPVEVEGEQAAGVVETLRAGRDHAASR